MALRNGLLVHGPTSWAIAVRGPGGDIEVASGPKPTLARGRLATVPFLRGPLRLAEALALVPLARLRLPAARLPLEDPRVIGAAVAATAASAAAPQARPRQREPRGAARGARRCSRRWPRCATATSRPTTAPSTRRSAPTSPEARPADEPKEHRALRLEPDRAAARVLLAGQVIVEGVLERPSPIARGAAALAATGAAVEVFAFAERNPDAAVARARPRHRPRDPAPDLDPGAHRPSSSPWARQP